MMFFDIDIPFQKSSKELAYKLRHVLEKKYNPEKLLVCMPYPFLSTKGMTKKPKKLWIMNKYSYVYDLYYILKNNNSFYGDTQITRPYMDYLDIVRAKVIFDKLRDIWADKAILIVEGTETRLGVGNDLFNNTRKIRRLLCPSKGAFDKYDDIYNSTLELAGDDLVLIALGPTATVLAADLADKGIWAIDIGHIDMEYEWFLRNAKKKIKIEGKFVNEVKDGGVVSECNDDKYLSEIIYKI